MRVTEVRLSKARPDDHVLAYGSVTFDDQFVVKGIRVVRRKDGKLFMAYPSVRGKDGTWNDLCFPINSETREEVEGYVLAQYEKECVKH